MFWENPDFLALTAMNAPSLLRQIALTVAMTAVVSLSAAPIPKLFSTGVDTNGVLLSANQIDPHYLMTASADPGFPGPDAFTLTPGFPVGPWIPEGPNSRWIAPQASQSTGNEPGIYTFTTKFDLTGLNPSTAQISGNMTADNDITAVRLNGTDLGITASGFNAFHPFSIPVGSSFVAGTNVLEFDASNAGTTVNPAGFRVEMTGRATGANESPSIITQPQSQTVVVGDLVTFAVEASGTAPLTYQWRFNGSALSNANLATYSITGARTNDAGRYSVSISNAAGQTNSADATLVVLIPFPGIYNTGVDSNRVVMSDDAIDPHYRLVVNPNNPSVADALVQNAANLPGAWVTNSSRSRWIGPDFDTSGSLPGNYLYELVLNLTGYDPATAFLAGSWATDDGGSLFLNGADTGFRSAGYASFSTFNLTNGFVSGTNLLQFRINNGAIGFTGLRVENLRGTAQAGGVTQSPPRIVTQPQGATRVITEDVTFTVVADGTQPFSYQWLHDGTAIPGKTASSLLISPVLASDAGGYSVRVSNALGSTNSVVAQLVVIQPQVGVFNTGLDTSGVALPTGDPDPHYALLVSPDAGYPGPTTYATAGPIPPWFANDLNSAWIAARPDGGAVTAPGTYRYRLIFSIDSSNDVATAAMTGNVGTDDGNGGVFLNGNDVQFGASGFGGLTALNLPAGSAFVAGLNTLDFVVNNGGTTANPSGLRVDDLVLTGVTALPRLAISRSGSSVRIAWPASATGFVLQETVALPSGWTNSADIGMVQGSERVVLITPTGTAKFFRMKK